MKNKLKLITAVALACALATGMVQAAPCPVTQADLQDALIASVFGGGGANGTAASTNGGFDLNMWAAVVDRDGVVCAVAKTGMAGEQWPGSRVISAQKANTANAFSLPGLALSTANLWAATQPGGSLFGLQHSNPVDTDVAYVGSGASWGTMGDDLVGEKIGGVNVFGGGLALYDNGGNLVGAVGVSGDSSCADHNIAWRVRDQLALDMVPGGVGSPGDNIIFDLTSTNPGKSGFDSLVSESGFGHPTCTGAGNVDVNASIVANCPLDGMTNDDCVDL